MLSDLSIRNKLILGFGSTMAVLVLLIGAAYHNFREMTTANGWNLHTLKVLRETDQISTSILQVQSSTRGFMLTGEERLVERIAPEETEARKHAALALQLTRDNPVQQERLARLGPLMETWITQVIDPLIAKRRELNKKAGVSQQVATYQDVVNGAQTVAEIRGLLDAVEADEERLLEARGAALSDLQHQQQLLLSAGGGAALLASLVIGLSLLRAITAPLADLAATTGRLAAGDQGARAQVASRDELGQVATEFNRMAAAIQQAREAETAATDRLRAQVDSLLAAVSRAASGDLAVQVEVQGADAIGRLGHALQGMFDNLRRLVDLVQKAGIQVTSSATEIAASARQQEATGVEQAQTSVEILATTREISANTQQLLKAMQEAGAVAEHTTHATADAQAKLGGLDESLQRMVAATDAIGAKLAALSDKAATINSVLTTITKVADQTNILSLNAAIEAEKAGDAGRGFAVVATEIRRLADQTSVSAWDIEQMLKDMQSAVAASVMGMDKFAEEIRRSAGEGRATAGQLGQVIEQVRGLAPQFELVLQGMQSQAVGAQQITETMNQLNDATQQTVDSLKATSAAVQQLQYAAGDLQASVANFTLKA
ncbi:MAG: methyl-accepting chemotaxis protein [Telluria sp.]